MSRQPPLPPGPPPRAPGTDSYRPGGPSLVSSQTYYTEPRRADGRDMYQFSGNDYNSRSSYDKPASPRGYAPGTSYRPAPPPAYGNYPSAPDSYRPKESSFDFRFEAPPSINPRRYDDRRDHRPRSPPRTRSYANENHSSFRQNSSAGYRGGARGGYRGRAGPRLASDRAFLKTNREPTPELMPGMEEDQNHVKYKALEGISDSDETDMDISDGEDDTNEPARKQARTNRKAADGDSVPRWSNPDPYTALPPPDESQRKKKDVVKLIRKARVETGGSSKTEGASEDFISFDFGGDEDQKDNEEDSDDVIEVVQAGVPGAPTGPRYSHRDNIQKQDTKPQLPMPATKTPLPKRRSSPIDLISDPALGNRKRTVDDEIKGPPLIHKPSKGKKNPPATGIILDEWRVPLGSTGTPWIDIDHSRSANMGVWLHKEIVDFYYHVRPREFEQAIRTKLVEDLRTRVRQKFAADIMCFGSFMAGLYLPTADMDLVMVSDTFMDKGYPTMASRSHLYKFQNFLQKQNLALPGSIEMIASAKVPLIKYADRVTGIRVDVSFENNTGVIANKTFQDWKTQFPAMPILVTLIKHFLAMRGLNEPVNGGIGGFSVTCLVVSLLQHMPQIQSRSMIAEHHLGEVLMEFFDLYGNQFEVRTTAIQFDPPALIRKDSTGGVAYNQMKKEKFTIIDPNRPDNDIAGGSTNTPVIRKAFSQAYNDLQKSMGKLQYSQDRQYKSILGCILAGNYRTFDLQREHLAHIHDRLIGPIDNRMID